jgi:tRNA threonylcarbamoyladenosine biosynthesis protein TsaB
MNVLALDTSGPVCGVAIADETTVRYEGAAVNRFTHSVSLLQMVNEAFAHTGLTVGDIDLFAAVVGPGSFTGVRIGVSTVKGLAHGAGKPCVGINALEALATGTASPTALVCPIQDARAGQVYGAAFTAGLPPVRALADVAAKLDDYLDLALAAAGDTRPLLFLGDGVRPNLARIQERLGARAQFAPPHLAALRPAAVCMLALARQGEQVDYLTLAPHYLRAPQAERARAERLAGGGV